MLIAELFEAKASDAIDPIEVTQTDDGWMISSNTKSATTFGVIASSLVKLMHDGVKVYDAKGEELTTSHEAYRRRLKKVIVHLDDSRAKDIISHEIERARKEQQRLIDAELQMKSQRR